MNLNFLILWVMTIGFLALIFIVVDFIFGIVSGLGNKIIWVGGLVISVTIMARIVLNQAYVTISNMNYYYPTSDALSWYSIFFGIILILVGFKLASIDERAKRDTAGRRQFMKLIDKCLQKHHTNSCELVLLATEWDQEKLR